MIWTFKLNLQWDPPSLKEVSGDMVEYYISPFNEAEPELELPTSLREPYMWEAWKTYFI